MVLQAEHYSTYIHTADTAARHHAQPRFWKAPRWAGGEEAAFTPGFGSFLTLWAVPSLIRPPRVGDRPSWELAEAQVEGCEASSLVFENWGQKWRAKGLPIAFQPQVSLCSLIRSANTH